MKKQTTTLTVIHLPIMILMLLFVASAGGLAVSKQKTAAQTNSQVLSENDERDEEDSDNSDEDEKDDNDEDSSQEDEDKEDNSDKSSSKSKQEKEYEREFTQNGMKVKEKVKVKTENGKTEIEREFETEVEEVEDEDLQNMEDAFESSHTAEDLNKYLKIKVLEANEHSQGVSGDTRIKIKVKRGLETAGLAEAVEELNLTLDESSESLTYKGVAQKSESLFGIFKISVPVDLVIDPETGEVIDQSQTLVSKILDLFSF